MGSTMMVDGGMGTSPLPLVMLMSLVLVMQYLWTGRVMWISLLASVLVLLLLHGDVGWAMQQSGMGGAIDRAEAFGIGLAASVTGVWIPVFALIGGAVTGYLMWTGSIGRSAGRYILAILFLSIALPELGAWFGIGSAAELDRLPAPPLEVLGETML